MQHSTMVAVAKVSTNYFVNVVCQGMVVIRPSYMTTDSPLDVDNVLQVIAELRHRDIEPEEYFVKQKDDYSKIM